MAVYPQQLRPREELNLRLGIKSSLSQLRSVVASLYVIYIANNKQPNVVYSKQQTQNVREVITLSDELSQSINAKYGNALFVSLVESSPLFTSQLESLQVGIELFFHLGKVDFTASNLSERTGSNRYQKKIAFATNIMLVDLLLSSYSDDVVSSLLLSWLNNRENNSNVEDKLCLMLNTFTEETQYKIRDTNESEIVFNQEGVYSAIFASDEVSSNDVKEPVGPFRVYKSFLSSGMHPFIIENRQTIRLKDDINEDKLKCYSDMVNTTLSLIPKRSIVIQEITVDNPIDETETTQPIQNTDTKRPHQQIFYGAPGTGKSHTIKCEVEGKNLPHIRTTFHPDSDYSTFVGAYKPTTIDVPMRDVSGHIIVEGGNQVIEKKIIYTFVPQVFLKAYVAAWSNLNEPFFLIIEEINRGNCAQIFGDLFQLLDRNSEGISDYPVTSDDDIRRYLYSKFSALDDAQRANIPDEILSGEKMLLPRNFHIWATMNTSDQSLFPIDSAFKRRWDWKYTPIANGNKNWKITADGKEYDWWQFLEKINAQIGDATHSEDKKLGYYFCKPINNQTIDAETFVSKVVFYLWNDVFKDFAEDAGSIFNDEDGTVLSFNKFYTTDNDGNAVVVDNKVTQLLKNLGVDPLQDVEE